MPVTTSTAGSGSSSKKREREDEVGLSIVTANTPDVVTAGGAVAATTTGHSTTNFRNVSACYRCRSRKNRCDQQLPKCSGCRKANVQCVGFDPVSKRAIPRNYVAYLEARVVHLEGLLRVHGLPVPDPEADFAINEAVRPGVEVPFPPQAQDEVGAAGGEEVPEGLGEVVGDEEQALDPALMGEGVANAGEQPVQSSDTKVRVAKKGRRAAHNSGVPFSKVVFAAVRNSVMTTPHKSENVDVKPTQQRPSSTASGGGGSDSFFGLNIRPSVRPAPFPERDEGAELVNLYMEYSNPQIPILHREEFFALFYRVYATDPAKRSSRELYLLNIVFATGAGIILKEEDGEQETAPEPNVNDATSPPKRKRQKVAKRRIQSEEYHAAAIENLDSFLSTPSGDGAGSGLEELQAVLLLAGLALLRPVAPGLWYIVGVAVRLAVDLGLYYEEPDAELDGHAWAGTETKKGRKQYTRDLRRRLWACVYNFDRLVSSCVGRPYGISDSVITTPFPSLLDDAYITPDGFTRPPTDVVMPSYKMVARHYFELRVLQSEILQVQQQRLADFTKSHNGMLGGSSGVQPLPSQYLILFDSFHDWRLDMDRRLSKWNETIPEPSAIGVAFPPLYLQLNYWQAVLLLYRQSLTVPEALAGELSPSPGGEVQSPGARSMDGKEDEEWVYMKVAQAGQMVLKIYRSLSRLHLVNYTYLATHHIFMAGTSFLYAVWQSTLVRRNLTMDDVDFTVFIATSVLNDLKHKCPPAEACKDAFLRMSKMTIAMVVRTTGFGSASTLSSQVLGSPGAGGAGYFSAATAGHGGQSLAGVSPPPVQQQQQPQQLPKRKLPLPTFDMNLADLFSDDELANRPLTFLPKARTSTTAFPFGNGDASAGSYTGPEISTTHQDFSIPSTAMDVAQPGAPGAHTSPVLPPITQQFSQSSGVQHFNQQDQYADVSNPPLSAAESSTTANSLAFDEWNFLDPSFPPLQPTQSWDTDTANAFEFTWGGGAGGGGYSDGNYIGEGGAGGGLLDDFFFGESNGTGF